MYCFKQNNGYYLSRYVLRLEHLASQDFGRNNLRQSASEIASPFPLRFKMQVQPRLGVSILTK